MCLAGLFSHSHSLMRAVLPLCLLLLLQEPACADAPPLHTPAAAEADADADALA